MKIAPNLPELSLDDAADCFMPPADLWKVAVSGDFELSGDQRFLNNISNDFVVFEKSGSARTSRRLYSALSAVTVRSMWELTRSGRSYDFASKVTVRAEHIAEEMITQVRHIDSINTLDWLVAYRSDQEGNPVAITRIKQADIAGQLSVGGCDVGILKAGDIVVNVLRRFAPYWERYRMARGLTMPPARYSGVDDQGRPLDPDHEAYLDLPPLERAKRRVEIEEFIARRESAKGSGDGGCFDA